MYESLNFKCPQFVDFSASPNGSSNDDVFFDCEGRTPGAGASGAISNLKTPNVSEKEKLSEGTENRLLNKMTAAMAILDNTPGIKKVIASKNLQRQHIQEFSNVTLNPNTNSASLFPSKMQRCKSVASIDKISNYKQNANKNREPGMRKRSSSLNDLKILKKQTYPTTPMCLKRTKFKSKCKIKTSEQLELEEIAKLQKQLKQHLRYNENSLKKLRLKSRDYMAGKNAQIKVDNNLKILKEREKSMKFFVDKANNASKEVRRSIQKINPEAAKCETFRNPTISSRMHSLKPTDNIPKPEVFAKPRNPPSALSTKNIAGPSSKDEKEPTVSKTTNPPKKFGFHTGVSFPENIKKFTVVKPFSFDVQNRNGRQRTAYDRKLDVWSNPLLKMDKNKENIPISKVQPLFLKRPEELKGTRQLPMAKKFEESRTANQTRGLALADNFVRKN